MKAGDYVLIEFGHNDGGAPDQPPFRGDLPGIGDEAQVLHHAGREEGSGSTPSVVCRKFVTDSKAKGRACDCAVADRAEHLERNKVERWHWLGAFGKWSQQWRTRKTCRPRRDEYHRRRYEKWARTQVGPLVRSTTRIQSDGPRPERVLIVAGLKASVHLSLSSFRAKAKRLTAAPDWRACISLNRKRKIADRFLYRRFDSPQRLAAHGSDVSGGMG